MTQDGKCSKIKSKVTGYLTGFIEPRSEAKGMEEKLHEENAAPGKARKQADVEK